MTKLVSNLYANVTRICNDDDTEALIEYLCTDGLTTIQQLIHVDTSLTSIELRDLGIYLTTIIPICYPYIRDIDVEHALRDMPSIDSDLNQDCLDRSETIPNNLLYTLNYIFDTLVRLFYISLNRNTNTVKSPISEIHRAFGDIAEVFSVKPELPELENNNRVIWFYQKKIRTFIRICLQISPIQSLAGINILASNCISSIITKIKHYLLNTSSTHSEYIIRFGFDILQGFAILIQAAFSHALETNSGPQKINSEFASLINQFLTKDYFSLFHLLTADKHYEPNATILLEQCFTLLRTLKVIRLNSLKRKNDRRSVQKQSENNYEQYNARHHHQYSFEITIKQIKPDAIAENKSDNEDNSQVKRICVIGAIYDRLLKLIVKQFESSQPLFYFIQTGLTCLASVGSCTCYPLTHYRALLSKLHHFQGEEHVVAKIERESIRLYHQAFILLSNCSQPNTLHHIQTSDNTEFWLYLSSHLFQRSSHYSLTLLQSFPELIQSCSLHEKQLVFKYAIRTSLEFYRSNLPIQNFMTIEMIECLIRTLINLLCGITIDTQLFSLSDTLALLARLQPSLVPQVLPALGSLLTSTLNSSDLLVAESFIQLIVELINSWTLSNESLDNLCHIVVILVQKCKGFQQAFYAQSCHLRLYKELTDMINNNLTIPIPLLSCVLVSVSYYTKLNDKDFNYKLVIERLSMYNEQSRYDQSWFDTLVRLSLSQQYQDKRISWKSSITSKNQLTNQIDDEDSTSSMTSSITDNIQSIDEEEVYQGDVESLSDEEPKKKLGKQSQTTYSNLIVFPELIILGFKTVWQNIDREWSDQPSTNKVSTYVANLVAYLDTVASLVRANNYNCVVLQKLNMDGFLFTCLTKIVPRASFVQKDTLISLLITILKFLWSQSITVNQLDECFKLMLIHRSLIGPFLRLFQGLVYLIDQNQPRSYCSMPSSSLITSKNRNDFRLTLEQFLSLKYFESEQLNESNSSMKPNIRQLSSVTETLKTVQFQFPLTVAFWLKVNYPFGKNDLKEDATDAEDKQNSQSILHILTLHHEGLQLQFWLDSKPNLILKILQLSTILNEQQLVDRTVCLYDLPRESWCHLFVTLSKTTKTVNVCLNGRTLEAKCHPIPTLYSSNSNKPWSISLGQQSLDICTYYYDLGSILLFDKLDIASTVENDYIQTYLFSLGSDHWHFLNDIQQQHSFLNYWVYERFASVHSLIPIDRFQNQLNIWHTTLRRSLVASYTSNDPWTLFLFNTNSDINEDVFGSRLNKLLTFRSSTVSASSSSATTTVNDDNALLATATTLSLPSKISLEVSGNILSTCERLGGILNFIYLFGKVIEIDMYVSHSCISYISDIIFTSIWKVKSYYDLFNSLDGHRLIVKILTTNECVHHISERFFNVLMLKCIVADTRLYDIHLFRFIMLEWKIWYRDSRLLRSILTTCQDLLSDSKSKYFYVNRQLFKTYFTLEHVLILCQELIEEQRLIKIDIDLANILVNIIEALVENDINIIALLMNFVLSIHPLIKTYVTYNKENFYFVTKPCNHYLQRKELDKETLFKNVCTRSVHRQRAKTIHHNEFPQLMSPYKRQEKSHMKRSSSLPDLSLSLVPKNNENDTHTNRRTHHATVSGASPTSTSLSPSSGNEISTNENIVSFHNIDYLSAGVLQLLTNIALTASDRLVAILIDRIFRLNILTVLLLDSSLIKRVQCLKLIDIILKRMDRDAIRMKVLQADLHIMLANQLYHQIDGHENAQELVNICLSIALQRPIQSDISFNIKEQTNDDEQYFSVVSTSPPCLQSQVGFALVLSLIEKLSQTNEKLCELVLTVLDQIILRSSGENRHFLVEIGLTPVLFNTLLSAISLSQNEIITCVQKCFCSLATTMYTTNVNDDLSFASVINSVIGMIVMDGNANETDYSNVYGPILHQTVSHMLNAIIDLIEKPLSNDIGTNQSTLKRASAEDSNLSVKINEYSDRFRKFLQISLDYIYLFHHECLFLETLSLRLLSLCLLGIAYLIEKRATRNNSSHQMSIIMIRCGDTIKEVGQKLLSILLSPNRQRFAFRLQVLKLLIDQPNAKGIMEYFFSNETQSYLYNEVLIYLNILSNTTVNSCEQTKNSFDSELSICQTATESNRTLSNADDSVVEVVKASTSVTEKKSTERRTTNELMSSTDDERYAGHFSNSAMIQSEPETNSIVHRDQSSSSRSLSTSSNTSELTTSQQQSSLVDYASIISSFRSLMSKINRSSSKLTDNSAAEQRMLNYLLMPSSSQANVQHPSVDWPLSASAKSAQLVQNNKKPVKLSRSQTRASRVSHALSPVINWSAMIDEKSCEYTTALNQTIDGIKRRTVTAQKNSLQSFLNNTITTITTGAMEITQDVINFQGFERKKYLEHLRLSQSLDLSTKHLWHQLISQLTHEFGIWFEPLSYPKFWELDPTENPQRERRRLQRAYCVMEKRFFQPRIPDEILSNPPLSYLFDTRHYQSVNIQTVLYRNEKIDYQCRCANVTPYIEYKGELLVGRIRIYFIADEQLSPLAKSKNASSAVSIAGYNYHSFNDDSNSFSFAIEDICEMYKRRYMLKDIALELFFINGITLMIAHESTDDRNNLFQLLSKRNLINYKRNVTVNEFQVSWRQCQMTNFDYLMQLNKLAGRTYLDLMQYPIFPHVVANYESAILDLRVQSNYRNLAKPISIQHLEREEKFIEMYRALEDSRNLARLHQQEVEQKFPLLKRSHQCEPYHYASLYSNSGIVLHYLVRLLPYTRMFLNYQDNNFDCADRTFHDMKTTYWLSSFESTSDFKELIPEFYYLHEFLLNKQGFNFGKRQNGMLVSDVILPIWSKRNARLFVYGLRQALESEYVTSHLHQWIDLIFGYKQTGKAAFDAINVYHEACYYGFPIDNINDSVIHNAYEGIIRTCGQVPKQLFTHPHPSSNTNSSILLSISSSNTNDKRSSERSVFESKLPTESIHRLITGVRWGDFVGSYDMPSPDYIKRHDCPISVASFAVLNGSTSIICLPPSSLVLNNEHIINEFDIEQGGTIQPSPLAMSLDTMIALKWNTPDHIVRCRQLKQLKTWYNFLVPIDDQDKITCCASIDHRLLFMGKTSGLIEIYRMQRNKNTPAGIELIKRYLPFIAHRSPITCLYANRQFSILISASADGMLTLWDTNRLSYVRTYQQENQTIYHLTSSETTGDIAYLSSSGNEWHLSYLTCNCDLIGCLTFSEQLNCLCFTSAPEGTCVNVLLGGFENGIILMWSTWDLTLLRQLDFPQLHSHAIVALCIPNFDRRRLYVVDRDRHLHTIESRVSSSMSMTQPQILFLS